MAGKNRNLPKYVVSALLIIVLIPVAWICAIRYQIYRHSLPAKVVTISEFLQEMTPPKYVFTFNRNDRVFIGFVGNMSILPSFPSGDPIYIFDDSGQIVYWTIDHLESSSDWIETMSETENKRISISEALQIVSNKTEKQ